MNRVSTGRVYRPVRTFMLRGCVAAALALALAPVPAHAQWSSPQVQSALKAAGGDRDIRAFYAARRYQPLWVRGQSVGPEAFRFLELVSTAELDGLDRDDYRPRALAAALERARSGSPKALAKAEMLLSRSFADYVRDARRPREIGMVYVDKQLAPTVPTRRAVLQAAAAAPSLEQHLETAGWMNPLYGPLRKALAAQRSSWSDGPPIYVADGPTLRTGATGERVRMLRLRLGLGGEGGFDGEVAARLRDFQGAHGLPVDGLAGPRTLAALNRQGGSAGQEQMLRVNLERARALPANPGRRYILVDAAAQRLWVYENGRVRDTMKVVVGKSTEQTPMMAGLIRFAMVNPYWNIPPDLVQVRVAPAVLGKGVSYLRSMRYEVLSDWSENARAVDPGTVDWAAVASGRRELPVRQLPGKDNAMGKMKFMFPNELGIYLHDTPEKHLFREADRRFSSGCVRLEDAPRLAKWLFGKPLAPRAGAVENRVNLPEPVPVYITYLTAAPEGDRIAFRQDVYNRDSAQLARLGRREFAAR